MALGRKLLGWPHGSGGLLSPAVGRFSAGYHNWARANETAQKMVWTSLGDRHGGYWPPFFGMGPVADFLASDPREEPCRQPDPYRSPDSLNARFDRYRPSDFGIEWICPFFSPDILSGWAVQVHSEIESVLGLPFSWTPSDRISINRLDRAWASLFRIVQLSDTAHQERLFGRIHEIILTRQSISRRASHSIKRLEKVSRGLSRTLVLTESGIVSVGMSAFVLFSLSVYFFRRTITSLDRVSVAKSYLSAILEAVPPSLLLKDSKGGWLLVNKAALDVFGLDERSWENRTDREIARENPVDREFFSACEKLDLEVMGKNEKTVSIETVTGKDGRSIKMEVTRIPPGVSGDRKNLPPFSRITGRVILDGSGEGGIPYY